MIKKMKVISSTFSDHYDNKPDISYRKKNKCRDYIICY